MRWILLAAVAAAGSLAVAVATGDTHPRRLSGYGLRMTLPRGWTGRIYLPPGNAVAYLQAATVPVARGDDDAGTRTRQRMRAGDVMIVLWETEPSASGVARWRRSFPEARLPLRIRPSDLGSFEGFGTAAARNFRFARRYFELFVVFGSRQPGRADFARANRALAGLRISPISPQERARLRYRQTRLRMRVSSGRPAGFERLVTLRGFGDFLWRCRRDRIETAYLASPGGDAWVRVASDFRHGKLVLRGGQSAIVQGLTRWRVTRGTKAIVQISRWRGCIPWVDAYLRPLRVR